MNAKSNLNHNDMIREQEELETNHCSYGAISSDDGLSKYLPIEDAIEKVGHGTFQYKILLATGLCFMADAMEILLMTFLSTVLRHEWNLSESEIDSILGIVWAGILLGALVWGRAGDAFGRKPVFMVTISLVFLAGISTAFCRTSEQLLAVRFWLGFGIGGLTVPFDLMAEFLPRVTRGRNLLYINFFWEMGTLGVPALAYLTLDTSILATGNGESHWQLYVILCSIPCFLSAFLGLVLVPESPRWLLQQSKRIGDSNSTRALEILKSAARSSGISQAKIEQELFPPNTRLVPSVDEAEKHLNNTQGTDSSALFFDEPYENQTCFSRLFGTPHRMSITMFLWATWFGFGFLYYGTIVTVSHVFNNEEEDSATFDYGYVAMNDDEGNTISYVFDWTAILVTTSAEVFGLCIVLIAVDSKGRIPSQVKLYRLGGISTFLLGIFYVLWIEKGDTGGVNDFRHWSLIALAFVSRMALMASSSVSWVTTTEILSTNILCTSHGVAHFMSRLASFVASYLITKESSLVMIGALVLLVSLSTAESASRLPETAGKRMDKPLA